MIEKQVVIRVGEACMLKDVYENDYINVDLVKEASTYFLEPEDLVFLSVIIFYDDFMNSTDPNDPVFQEYVYCNSWKLVSDIDSPIFLRTKTHGEGFEEEKWEDIGFKEIKNLGLLLSGLDEDYPVLDELKSHYLQKSRDMALKNIGL